MSTILACVAFAAIGCGQASSPTQVSTPKATTYVDPAALYGAVEQAGAPRIEDLKTDSFAGAGMPASANAARGNFLVAVDGGTLTLGDGTPATNVVSAVFPDAGGVVDGRAYGAHMTQALGYPSIWQLEGPNWLIWSVERDALHSLQAAIGGALSATAQPSP